MGAWLCSCFGHWFPSRVLMGHSTQGQFLFEGSSASWKLPAFKAPNIDPLNTLLRFIEKIGLPYSTPDQVLENALRLGLNFRMHFLKFLMAKYKESSNRSRSSLDIFRAAAQSGNIDLIKWVRDQLQINVGDAPSVVFSDAGKVAGPEVLYWFLERLGRPLSLEDQSEMISGLTKFTLTLDDSLRPAGFAAFIQFARDLFATNPPQLVCVLQVVRSLHRIGGSRAHASHSG